MARPRVKRLLGLQVALIWQLNFGYPDLRAMQLRLLDGLELPRESSVRSLAVEQSRQIQHLFKDVDQRLGAFPARPSEHGLHRRSRWLERIRNTPIPPPYDMFVRMINWIFGTNC